MYDHGQERLQNKLPIREHSRESPKLWETFNVVARRMFVMQLRRKYPGADVLDVQLVGDPVLVVREGDGWRQVRRWDEADAVHYVADVDFLVTETAVEREA